MKKRTIAIIILLISTPVLFFGLAEVLFRIAGYGQDLALFIDTENNSKYLRINPQIGSRYFLNQKFQPEVSNDWLPKEKAENTKRFFVFGGSSAAGYPYMHNGSFARILRLRLQKAWPNRNIEVINVAMTAVNSHTIRDLLPDIFEHQPDAVLLYAGHNEFYGALGGGSIENVGNSHFIRGIYLTLVHSRFFQWFRTQIAAAVQAGNSTEGTLMRRMVGKAKIPLNGDLYQTVKNQYRENLNHFADLCADHETPLFIANMVSNLADQPPFITLPDEHISQEDLNDFLLTLKRKHASESLAEVAAFLADYPHYKELAAHQYFSGKIALADSQKQQSYELLRLAKDGDALRFRAPSDFNEIIAEVSERTNVHLVDAESAFRQASPLGVPGNNLFLEHLHPNIDGQYILADVFYRQVTEHPAFRSDFMIQNRNHDAFILLTALDSTLARYKIKALMNDWPFRSVKKTLKLSARTFPELVAREVFENDLSWEEGQFKLGQYYIREQRYQSAIGVFNALIGETPYNISPYLIQIQILVNTRQYPRAMAVIQRALKLDISDSERFTLYKTGGSILLNQKEPVLAIEWLAQALALNAKDEQVLYNMIGANVTIGRKKEATEYFNQYRAIAANPQKLAYLSSLIAQLP
jgi:tetratricopeptide (TPR) repeat protein